MKTYKGCRVSDSKKAVHHQGEFGGKEISLGLGKYGVVVDMEASATIKFKCLEDGWEEEARTKKSSVNKFRLLQKYKNVRFFGEYKDQIYVIFANNPEWLKTIKKDPTAP